ncbi:MAG: glycosyltransferase family 9 protein [Candidatus Aminicenantes bacterium]|nr:glycosyltransferase family 9 protein [Candidatus Aminicenantes bacterium]
MESFLIVRLSSLGDIIHTLPAFSLLRQNFPKTKIFWVTQAKASQILELVPGIDEIIVIEPNLFFKALALRNKKIDLSFDFQGLLKSALVAFLSGAKKRFGFNRQNLKEPLAHLFYTDKLPAIKEFDHHVIYKNLKLLELIGLKIDWNPASLTFPLAIPKEITEKTKLKLTEIGLVENKPLIIFNVGASWESKRLPTSFWIETINLVKKEMQDSFNLALLWGNQEELTLAKNIHEKTKIYLLPFLDLKETIALISIISLLVSGDTFALQVASALNTSVVGLFGPTSPIRNGPFRPNDVYIYSSINCSPCYRRRCSQPRCWQAISPQRVVSAIINRVKRDDSN